MNTTEEAGSSPPQPPAKPRPLVDDSFWFERSKEMIQGASSKRTEAAGKLQTTIGWFWTVYTAGAVIGVTLAEKDFEWWESVLIALPIPVLVLAYWLAGWAQIPIGVRFDPRSPDEIRLAHQYSARKKKRRLGWATFLSALGAVLVTVAVLTASWIDDEGGSDESGFSAAFDKDELTSKVVVGGDFPAGTKVVIAVTPKDGMAIRKVAVTPESGELHRSFDVPLTESYGVTATWDEEKVGTWTLTKTVKGEKVEN